MKSDLMNEKAGSSDALESLKLREVVVFVV